ncbi:MAG: hypothetical protein AB2591_08940 [Candidatus Thiodiazotropha sp.]|nr:MAG: hypothetical protein DBP03_00215 [gamma proteobacterium symbiont of Ctena orbiculata]
MRTIRKALALIGLLAEEILKHAMSLVVYGMALAKNFRDVLIGKHPKAQYYLPQKAPEKGTEKLGQFWIRRWLDGRITREGILDQVPAHTLDYPINHRARVPLNRLRAEFLPKGELDFGD